MYLRNHNINKNNTGGKRVQDDALLCFCLLLTTIPFHTPYDDPLIKRFAGEVGGAFGKWLLDLVNKLTELLGRKEYFVRPGPDFIFRDRDPNVSNELGLRYLEEVMPSRDLFKKPVDWMKGLY